MYSTTLIVLFTCCVCLCSQTLALPVETPIAAQQIYAPAENLVPLTLLDVEDAGQTNVDTANESGRTARGLGFGGLGGKFGGFGGLGHGLGLKGFGGLGGLGGLGGFGGLGLGKFHGFGGGFGKWF